MMRARPVAERMAALLQPDAESGCLNWTGYISRWGYGLLMVDRRPRRVHRVAYEAAKGPIPDGLVIDHLCRNRRCANPDHLEAVTPAENTRRGGNAIKTHCLRGHEFTPENTKRNERGGRICLTCIQAYARARYERMADEIKAAKRAAYVPKVGGPGRGYLALRTHCAQGHGYTPENTHTRPDGSRRCRTCHAAQARARYRKGAA